MTSALKAELQQKIEAVKNELAELEAKPEYYIFTNTDVASGILKNLLFKRALLDCEKADFCGQDEYSQRFLVDGKEYIAVLNVKYIGSYTKPKVREPLYLIQNTDFRVEPV